MFAIVSSATPMTADMVCEPASNPSASPMLYPMSRASSQVTPKTDTHIIPVSYAVTYIFGTAGSAWVLSSIGPKMLGGLDKVKAACKDLEVRMGNSQADEPGFIHAARPVTFRAYRIENEWLRHRIRG